MKTKDQSINLKILQCAKSEFMDKGFADASMRRIAEKAGVTQRLISDFDRGKVDRVIGWFAAV